MKKQLQRITLLSALFLSAGMSVFGQVPNCVINASENTICSGETVTLSVIDNSINDTIVFPGNNSIPIIGSSFEYSSSLPPSNWTTTSGGWTTGSLPYIGVNTGSVANSTFWPIGTTYYLRKQIDLTNYDLTSINWKIAVDNGYTLYLNGQQIATAYEGGPAIEWEYSGFFPTNILVQGINTIAIRISDDGAGAAVFNMLLTGNPIIPTIQWSNGLTIPTITVTPNQTTNYTCTLSNGSNSCQATTTIIVNNNPSVNLGSDTLNICGLTTTLDATNPVAASYSWNTGEITPGIIVSSSGEYHITVTDTSGCSSSDSTYVSVVDPTIAAGQPAFCLGDSTIISINDVSTSDSTLIDQFQMNMFQALNHTTPNLVSGENYILKVSGTVGFSGGVDSQDAAYQYNWFGSPLTPYAFPSPTSVWWYVNGSNNFRPDQDSYNGNHIYYFSFVGNNQPLTITWTDNPYGDNSGQLNFQLLKIESNSTLSYWWSDGTTNQTSIQVQPTQTTTYSVTVSDGVGSCTDSITIQVNNPQINAGPDISVCAGDSTTLTATGASTYAWDNGVVNGQAFLPTVEGYYNVIGTDTLGCSNSVSIFLDLLQPTSSSISPVNCVTYTAPDGAIYTNSGQYTAIIPNAAGCDSTISINLTINNASSGTDTHVACDSYTWIDGNTYTSSTNSATFVLTNANGCDSTVTLNLTINKLNGLNAGNDINACQGENITLSASGATSYNWTGGVSNGDPFVPPAGTTIYTVTGTDDNGCTATDALTVLVEYCLDIPGGISPNGDNSNDTWTINGLNQYPDAKIFVFDRWGQKVFSGDATNPTWNGTYEGKELPTADYYYIIELGNGEKFNGVVTLKK
jgi:gliding motility-associated-like protein